MIVEPEQRVPDFIKAGADIVSVHCEQSSTIHLHRTLTQVRFFLDLVNAFSFHEFPYINIYFFCVLVFVSNLFLEKLVLSVYFLWKLLCNMNG